MVTASRRTFTPDEYLLIERGAEFRSQYIHGEIYSMAGASERHNLITANLTALLHAQLRGKPCRVYQSDMRVRTPNTKVISYPDVVVACPPLQLLDERGDTLLNPTVIIEVLSDSTESFDRGDKWLAYEEIPTLTDYVLISQNAPKVEHFTRLGEAEWTYRFLEGVNDVITLERIDCSVVVSDVYEKVEFG